LRDALEEPDKSKKGWKFEFFFENLMTREKEFVQVYKHVRSETGEIDYVYRHNLQDEPFWRISSYVCIECKNWLGDITSNEIHHLAWLIHQIEPLPCLGVFITSSSYTSSAKEAIKNARLKEKIIIVPIGRKDLNELINVGFKNLVQKIGEETVFKR